jgi:hypothetical protein
MVGGLSVKRLAEAVRLVLVTFRAYGGPGVARLQLGVCHARRNQQRQRAGKPPHISLVSHRYESSAARHRGSVRVGINACYFVREFDRSGKTPHWLAKQRPVQRALERTRLCGVAFYEVLCRGRRILECGGCGPLTN